MTEVIISFLPPSEQHVLSHPAAGLHTIYLSTVLFDSEPPAVK